MENRIRLYTSGKKADLKAFDKFQKFIQNRITTHYTSEIIDIFKNPVAADQDNIVSTPKIIFRVSP